MVDNVDCCQLELNWTLKNIVQTIHFYILTVILGQFVGDTFEGSEETALVSETSCRYEL